MGFLYFNIRIKIYFWENPQSPIYSNKNPLVQSILVPVDIEISKSQDHNWQWPNCKRAPHFITICGDKSSSRDKWSHPWGLVPDLAGSHRQKGIQCKHIGSSTVCVTGDETSQNGFGATLKYSLPPLLGRIVSHQPPRIYEYHKALIRPHLAGRLTEWVSPLGMMGWDEPRLLGSSSDMGENRRLSLPEASLINFHLYEPYHSL